MKKYEGLFILNTAGREEGIKEAIDRITNEIQASGGKVETVQKMDKRSFSRIADKKVTSGFYLNVIFDGKPDTIKQLRSKLSGGEEIYRVIFTEAAPPAQLTRS